MPQHIKLFSTKSTSALDVFLIEPENVAQVTQTASGWIRFAQTTISHRLIYGDVLSVGVILGSRNVNSRLSDDDDNEGSIRCRTLGSCSCWLLGQSQGNQRSGAYLPEAKHLACVIANVARNLYISKT